MVTKLPVVMEVILVSCCRDRGVMGRSDMINDGLLNDVFQPANVY
jgi:hypothetical protein